MYKSKFKIFFSCSGHKLIKVSVEWIHKLTNVHRIHTLSFYSLRKLQMIFSDRK